MEIRGQFCTPLPLCDPGIKPKTLKHDGRCFDPLGHLTSHFLKIISVLKIQLRSSHLGGESFIDPATSCHCPQQVNFAGTLKQQGFSSSPLGRPPGLQPPVPGPLQTTMWGITDAVTQASHNTSNSPSPAGSVTPAERPSSCVGYLQCPHSAPLPARHILNLNRPCFDLDSEDLSLTSWSQNSYTAIE